RKGNEVWNGVRKTIVVDAGRNDFASFQLAVENTLPNPALGLDFSCSDLLPETPFSPVVRHLRLSRTAPAAFQTAMGLLQKSDPAAAAEVFSALDRVHAIRAKQTADAKAFFLEMEDMCRLDEGEYQKWTSLLAEGDALVVPGGIAAAN